MQEKITQEMNMLENSSVHRNLFHLWPVHGLKWRTSGSDQSIVIWFSKRKPLAE